MILQMHIEDKTSTYQRKIERCVGRCEYSMFQGFYDKYVSEKDYAKTFYVSVRFLQGFPQYANNMQTYPGCEISDVESRCYGPTHWGYIPMDLVNFSPFLYLI